MSNGFVKRAISGIVLAAVMVGFLWWNSYSRFFVLSLIGVAGCWEFLSLYKKQGVNISRCFALISAIVLVACSFFDIPLTLPIATIFLLRAIFELYRKDAKPLESMSYEALAILYTVFPMILLYQFDLIVIFAVVIFVWINDVGAYLVGSTIGKRRLFERLSPKKSWEGFIGGFLFSIVGGFLFFEAVEDKSLTYWILISAIVSLSAVFGDLFESMLKRSVNIKDSGNLIPGHGGVLDRFDALYFAALSLYVVDCVIDYLPA